MDKTFGAFLASLRQRKKLSLRDVGRISTCMPNGAAIRMKYR